MSLCVAMISKDCAFVGVDSAVSSVIHDKIYRVHEKGKKIWTFNNQIIFCSGKMTLSNLIMDTYEKQEIRTIDNLIKIAKEIEYKHKDEISISSLGECTISEILFVEVKNNKVLSYIIYPSKNYEINLINPGEGTTIWTGGFKSSEANKLINKYMYEGLKRDRNFNLAYAYQQTYDNVADEGVGGILKIYSISESGTDKFYDGKIEEKNIKRLIKLNDSYYTTSDTKVLVQNANNKNYNYIYLGNSNFELAPFRVNLQGDLTVQNADVHGRIDCEELKIDGTDVKDELNQLASSIEGTTLKTGVGGITKIEGNIVMAPGSSINWENLPSDVASTGQIPTKPGDIGALPASALPSYITSTKITSTTIESPNIVGGKISSNTTINVGTDATIGNNLYLNPSNWSGIHWGSTGVNIYSDSGAKSLILNAPGGVYAGGQRIDQPLTGVVAIFG
ncbi:hypothetical protein [Desulforamulus aeronauticus]|uniref:Uncharacterized protein n=1 Tax=Desulforamulus aeronauticus DSM 10349 TaxID=1121421 RepID=A0A1M6SBA6_9FIRM|nr:hypothetical protein [Desulforamulus aeronauticus]SHK41986.1 hypothetical protein SAMN02745123_01782 [Desulforamulus aeronauticus DSM 10349]